MKTDEVIARSLVSARSEIVTCVPGFGGTQVFENLSMIKGENPVFSFHEEVAFASALGAAISGKRSAMLTKIHGLAKAANALTDSLYMDVNAGMVILAFEDKQGRHSDNILDAGPLLKGLKIPFHETGENEISEAIYAAFEQSENIRLPVVLLFDAAIVDQPSSFAECGDPPRQKEFKRDLHAQLVVPVFAGYQYKVMKTKLLGVDPGKIEKPAVPVIPDGLPPDYAEYVKPYMPLMDVFTKVRGRMVFGDTGISTLFAFPPYACVDACSYMGGSVAMALGACLAGYTDTWAITGDFSFIAAGHLGLIEAISKNIPVKILIFKNNRAQTTGGQKIRVDILDKILLGYRDFVRQIDDPTDKARSAEVLETAAKSDRLEIIVASFTN